MTAIWLIIWAIHSCPPLSTPQQSLNAYGIWLCICGALDFMSDSKHFS